MVLEWIFRTTVFRTALAPDNPPPPIAPWDNTPPHCRHRQLPLGQLPTGQGWWFRLRVRDGVVSGDCQGVGIVPRGNCPGDSCPGTVVLREAIVREQLC